jgi:hypothetical protein
MKQFSAPPRRTSLNRAYDNVMTARRRRNLHLMADHGSAGVWDHDGTPLDPAKLPLNPKLRGRLARWSARFQKSFETEIDLDAFAAEGRATARAVKAELPAWSIVYFDEAAARAKYQGAAAAYEIEIP